MIRLIIPMGETLMVGIPTIIITAAWSAALRYRPILKGMRRWMLRMGMAMDGIMIIMGLRLRGLTLGRGCELLIDPASER